MNLPQACTLHSNNDRLDWPETSKIGNRQYKLLADYRIEWEADGFPRQRLVVPKDFEFDGASVPGVLEWYIPRGKILPPAVAHDWQYAYAGRIPSDSHFYLDPDDGQWKPAHFVWSRKEADRFFARNLRFCEIRNDQRRNAYRAVRLAGWIPWRRAERRMTKLSPATT